MEISLKYGRQQINFQFDSHHNVDVITPLPETIKPLSSIAINFHPLIDLLKKRKNNRSDMIVGIAINDKTRPVPYSRLIPPLVNHLLQNGINEKEIIFL